MQINSLQSVGSTQQINSIQQSNRAANSKASEPVAATSAIHSPVDQLDLSSEAQQLMSGQSVSTTAGDDIRLERVNSIRQAIADGTYETPGKLSSALDRLLDTLV